MPIILTVLDEAPINRRCKNFYKLEPREINNMNREFDTFQTTVREVGGIISTVRREMLCTLRSWLLCIFAQDHHLQKKCLPTARSDFGSKYLKASCPATVPAGCTAGCTGAEEVEAQHCQTRRERGPAIFIRQRGSKLSEFLALNMRDSQSKRKSKQIPDQSREELTSLSIGLSMDETY